MENKLRLLAFFLLLSFIPRSQAQQIPASTRAAGVCGTCAPDGWTPGAGTPDVSDNTVAATTATAGGGANWTNSPGGTTSVALPAPPNGHTNWITIRDIGTVAGEEDIYTTMTGLVAGREYELTIYSLTAVTRENGGAAGNLPYAGTYIDQFDFVVGNLPRVAVTDVSQNVWGTNKLRFTATDPSMQLRFYPGFNSPANGSTTVAGMRLMECVNISVTLDALNTIPVAEDKNTTTPIGTPVDVDVVEGAIDYDGFIVPGSIDLDPTTDGQQTSVTTTEGTWTVNPDGIVTFTPAPGFSGEATLLYTIEDDYSLDGVSTPGVSTPKTITVFVENPSLSITKATTFTGEASLDDVVEYTFTVTNNGNMVIENIVVEDLLLGGIIPNTSLAGGSSWPVTAGTLAPGESVILTGSYTVTEEDIMAGEVVNTASVSGDDPTNPTTPLEYPSDPVTVETEQANPLLTINKSTSFVGWAQAGDVISYTFEVTNEGNLTIENIVVEDLLLGGVIPNSSLAGGSSWPAMEGTLAPGESVVLTADYTVIEADVTAGELMNKASVSGDDPTNTGDRLDPAPSNSVWVYLFDPCAVSSTNPDSDGDGISDACDLDDDNDGILDTEECPFEPTPIIVGNTSGGELIEYNTETNTYNTLCSGISLGGGAIVGDIAMGGDGVIWGITSASQLIRIDPGNCAITVVVPDLGFTGNGLSFLPDGNLLAGGGSGNSVVSKIDVVGGTYATSTWVDFGSGFSNGDYIFIANKVYVLWFDSGFDPTYPYLIEVTVDDQFDYVSHTTLGTLPRYTWGLAKANGNQLFGVTGTTGVDSPPGSIIRINVDPSSFSWATMASYPQQIYGATSLDESFMECDTDGDGIPNRLDLDSDSDGCPDAVEYYGTLDPPTGGSVNPDGTIGGAPYTGNYANAVAATQLSIITQPADITAVVGEVAIFSAAAGAIRATTFDGGMPVYTGSGASDVSPGLIYQWQESVDGGDTWVDLTDGGQYSGTATDELTVSDVVLEQKDNQYRLVITHDMHVCPEVSAAALLNIPFLSFAKTGVLSADGNTVEYTFTVTNGGNVTMEDITLAEAAFSGTGTAPVPVFASNSGSSPEGTLAPDEVATYTATYTLTQADKDAGGVENLATVTGTPPTTDPDNPADPIEPVPSTPDPDNPGTPGDPGIPTIVDVPANPALSFAKTGVLSADGNTVEYTFTVTNTGNVTMEDITLAEADFSGTGTAPVPVFASNSGSSPEGTLIPGEVATYTATYTLTQADKDAGGVENAATVTGTPPTTDPDNPADPIEPVPSTPDPDNPGTPGDPGIPTEVAIPADPALSFAKMGVLSADGNTVEYTFTVTNTGNVTMEDITLAEAAFSGTGTAPVPAFASNSGSSPEGTLAPGEVATYTATYTLTQADKDAGGLENLATVTGTPPTTDPDNPADPIEPVPSTPDPDNPGTPGDPGIPTEVVVPADPALSFAKTGVLSADGNTIEYTFTVTNTGNVTMEDITLAEAAFSGTGTAPVPVFASNSGSSPEGTLIPGEVATYTATYTLTQADKDAGGVENAATVTGTPPTTDPDNPADPIEPVPSTPDPDNPGTPGDPGIPTEVAIPADPALSFAKMGVLSADGNTVEYTFTVTNTGNVTMEDITLAEAAFSGTGTAPVPAFASNSGSSPEGTLAPGEVATYTATYTLTQADKDAGGVENAATVTGTPPFDPADPTQPGEPIDPVPSTPDPDNPGTPGDPGIPTEVVVPADPALSFAKTGVLSADGNTIEYTFTVTNTGNVTMEDITVTDPKITGAITLDVTTLAPGEAATGTATYTVTQEEKDAGVVENQATVTGTPPTDSGDPGDPIDPVPSTPDVDNPGTPGNPGVPTEVEVPADPALSFAKTGVLFAEGNTIEYTFTVTNTGNVTLTDITVDDPKITGAITFDVTELAPGEVAMGTATYTVTQAEKDAGEVENLATVTGTPPTTDSDNPAEPIEPVPSTPDVDNPGTPDDPGIPTIVDVPADPSLSFAKTGVLFAEGNTIEYTFTVTNTGNVTLTGVEVTDPKITDPIVLAATTLVPGESTTGTATYTVTQAEKDAGEVENAATVTGTPPFNPDDPTQPGEPIDPVPSTPDVDDPGTPGDPGVPTVVEVPADPALSFAKTGVLSADGNSIEYTFTVTNTGNVTMTGVTVTDPKITGTITLDETTLAPGEVATGTATYTITQAEKDAGEVENLATATGTPPTTDPDNPAEPIDPVPSTPDPDNPGTPGDPGVPTTTNVPSTPSLTLTKVAIGEGPYAIDDDIEYEIVVRNTGNVTLTDIVVTDDNAEIVSGSPVASLAPNTTATVVARHQITQADIDAAIVVNQAKVTGNDPGGNPIPEVPSNNPDTPQPNDPTVVELTQRPGLTLTKRAIGEGLYGVDDYIDYEIVIRNTGNVTLTDVTVTDNNAEIIDGSPVASLAPSATATVIARHEVTQTDIDAGTVVNQATATGNNPEGNAIPEVLSDNPDTPQPNDPTVVELTQKPGLSLTKRITGEGPYTIGQYINYELTVTNTGNVTLTDVVVTDNNAAIVSGSPVANLAPSAMATVIARHQVTQADIDAGTVVNQAKATGDDPDGDPIPEVPSDNPDTPQPNDPTVVELTQSPSLALTKRATGEGPYALGQYINYELTVTNTGNVTLTDVTVTDNNAEITAGSPIASLAPNTATTVIARHRVTQADIDAGTVVNQAKVTGDDPDGNPIAEVPSDNPDTPQPNDPTVVELTQRPGLALNKRATGEGPYTVGDYIDFEITVTNTGNVTLTDVAVTDSNAEIVSGSPVASLAPNKATTVIARHQVTQADIDAGRVVNQAKVTGDDPDGNPIAEVPSDNPDTPQPNDPTVVELTQRPALVLAKRATGEGPYTVGDYIDFEITVTNTGNVTLTDVAVTDSNAEIVSGSPVASLAPNKAATVIVRHQVTQADIDGGMVVNQAKVTGDDPDGNPIVEVPSDNPDTPQPNDPTVVELAQQPSLVLTKRVTGEGPYAVNQYINYEIAVRNTGNVTLTDVTVTDDNAEITAGSPIANLAPNTTVTVIARHQVTQADIDAGTVVNQAKVTGDDPDGNPIPEVPSDNPDTPQPNDPTVVELTQRPGLALTKRSTGEGPYAVGDYIDYEITVRNTGNVTLTDVTVTDNNAEIIAGSPIASLLPGARATVVARHPVTQADIDAGTVVNQATATANDPDGTPIPEVLSDDPNTSEPNDPTVIYMESRPGLSLTKGVTSEGPYGVGDQIKYFNIVVTNTGNVTLTDVVVTDDNAEILAGSPIARLRPGESVTVTARHVVTQADVDAGEVINQARVSGNDPGGNRTPEFLSDDPNTPEPGDKTITAIAQAPAIRIDKVADRELVEKAGDRIGYQLQVINTGNVTLHDVEITDPLTGFIQQIARIRPGIINAHTFRTTYVTTAADLVVGKIVNTAMVMAVAPNGSEVNHAATVEVEAYLKEIEVENDDFGPVNGRTGGNVGNVFINDKVNGSPLVPEEVILTRVPSDDPSPLALEEDGMVTVAPNTPAGMYSFDYQVCDIINPSNCEVATVTVVVAPAEIKAVGDQVTGVNGYQGTSNVANVFANDQLNGAPIVPEEVTLTLVSNDPALQLNPDGSVDVVPGTRGGTYTLTYQICEKLNPDNCSVATVTVTVVNPLKIPNVFTPNGDGRNDQFEIIGSEGFDRIEVTIINRWGSEVYRNKDYKNDWAGEGLTEGTYYYLITTHLGSTKEVHKGWVLIKRL